MTPNLFLVATPIGNLSEMTPRSLETLDAVDMIFCEDTRHFAKLKSHFEIATPMQSFHQGTRPTKVIDVLDQGQTAALVCDAGAPTISDPGFRLVRSAIDAGHEVSPIGVNSAFLAAVICSGFDPSTFAFCGFIPHKKGRQTFITNLLESDQTIVFYESGHRIVKLLEQMVQLAPELEMCVAKELTKLHERFFAW